MTDSTVRDLTTRKLKKTQSVDGISGEIFFYKSLNLHRCVLVADLSRQEVLSPDQIRKIVCDHQRSNWFRGMGFGVFLTVNSIDEVGRDFDDAIDVRNNGKGTWQWTILHSREQKRCVGYHTWTHGYMSDIFQNVLRAYQHEGYLVTDQKAQMDGFLQFATKWTRQGRLIKQYQEIFPREQDLEPNS